MRSLRAAFVLAGLCALVSFAFGENNNEPELLRITPAQVGDLLVCRLQTAGLPGEKQLQSMRSGLVSAVELDLALVDANDETIGGHSLSFSFGFDLWEEVFSVRQENGELRFNSLVEMRTYLSDLGDLPVAPASLLTGSGRYRIRAGLIVHAIAPDEQERVEDVIAGHQRPRREGQDQQEASVSLGHLIRLFYKGGGPGEADQELLSGWFTGKELTSETD
jgi:hypothetical protein